MPVSDYDFVNVSTGQAHVCASGASQLHVLVYISKTHYVKKHIILLFVLSAKDLQTESEIAAVNL